MTNNHQLWPAIYEGWRTYQSLLVGALRPLTTEQLALRSDPSLRSVDETIRHIIGARARWFYRLMGDGGEAFDELSRWDRRGQPARTAEELVSGLERTWHGMESAISSWSQEAWEQTWPGIEGYGPEILTRQWVIWHLIEHDLHHGGEVSLTLGMHGLAAPDL